MANNYPMLVVGVGASAGGLEAFEHFFRDMPADTGVAFVLITHMARGQVSAMQEILARFTPMKVVMPTEATELRPNNVYVAPPDFLITQSNRTLKLHERGPES